MRLNFLILFFLVCCLNIFSQRLTVKGKVFVYNRFCFKYKGSLQYNFISDSIVEVTTKVHDLKSIEKFGYYINSDTIFISKERYFYKKRRLRSVKDNIVLKQI